jgi:uncharacterized protein YdeI (YjbR/CyaY-like superfamily)
MPEEPLALPSRAAWEAWLERHHEGATGGVWLALAKKGVDGLAHPEALEVALCFGWIDAQRKALDGERFLQRFVPRRARSRWSRINRDAAEALIASGAMRPAGLREVQRAQADGRWDAAYEGQRSAAVPEDLQAALDADPAARDFFATLDSQNRYAILYRVEEAKRPETRARRIAKFVQMLHDGRRLHER